MKLLAPLLVAALLAGCASAPPPTPVPLPAAQRLAQATEEVRATEIAFARTMAVRDHAAFTSYLAEETIFFSPQATRGKKAVADAWARFYQRPEAPFSWEPDDVQVLDSGNLALSTGPVYDPKGTLIGRFMSIWRQEAPGVWKIIFDKGCQCPLK
ncbi:YybH family protein [Ramlibacter albus]|uniref:Nuclear transport factor 2 family protein n=1 Tax=Ramlibacter albus TaxID=2079448 RepID=A0A923S345_9BURK|nr:nuclear transport factor 2 family protein [Ramlibacter albus]MBC5765458.1 nuclear transport factor 2 family protein [Ramlibacter albus]